MFDTGRDRCEICDKQLYCGCLRGPEKPEFFAKMCDSCEKAVRDAYAQRNTWRSGMPRIKDKLKKSVVDKGVPVKIVGTSTVLDVISLVGDDFEVPRSSGQHYPGKARHFIHLALNDGTSFQAEVDESVHAELVTVLRDKAAKEP